MSFFGTEEQEAGPRGTKRKRTKTKLKKLKLRRLNEGEDEEELEAQLPDLPFELPLAEEEEEEAGTLPAPRPATFVGEAREAKTPARRGKKKRVTRKKSLKQRLLLQLRADKKKKTSELKQIERDIRSLTGKKRTNGTALDLS